MNKREAIAAMLDGKKVRQNNEHWGKEEFIHFSNNFFCDQYGDSISINSLHGDDWEICGPTKKVMKKKFVRWVFYDGSEELGHLYTTEHQIIREVFDTSKIQKIEFELEVEE